jgi:CHAT domain-containing protein/tetratricopeptide (TPR) repeat protein
MRPTVSLVTFFLPLLAIGCSVPKYQPTAASYQQTIAPGEIQKTLASLVAQAREAEKNASAGWFSQAYWVAATEAYSRASTAAIYSGQLEKSIAYGEKALETAEKIKGFVVLPGCGGGCVDQLPAIKIRALTSLANAYKSVRSFVKARGLIERGLEIVEEIPSNWPSRVSSESSLYRELGEELMRSGEHVKAIEALSVAVYLREDYLARFRWNLIRDAASLESARISFVNILALLGNAYRQARQPEQALEQYRLAFTHINEWKLKYPYGDRLYVGMGELYRRRKNLPQALENLKKALAVAEDHQRPDAIISASTRIGDVLRQIGKSDEATPLYQGAIQQIESTRSLLQSEEYRQSYFEGAVDAYIGMIDALLLAGKSEEAFNYSERSRSRAFLDLLGSKAQLSRVKSGLLGEERTLQERIAAIRARLSGEDVGEVDRAGLRKELSEAEAAYSAFLSKVRKEDKEQASLMTVEPLGLKEVQELLDPGTTLLEYFVTGKEVFAWVVEKEKLQFQRIELPKEKLSGLVKTLRESIFTLGEREKFDETSGFLYKQLIEPLLPHITGKELIIVPHDVLHYLPFHALVGSDGRYLIEKYPIYYLSSASLLQFVKEKRKAGGEKVLALGNPDLGDSEKNLEYAELEAEEVKNIYPQSTVYVKKEASEEKSKSLSPSYDLLHFATHAQLNEDDPLSSAVLLAKGGKEDGRLEVREIFGMDLKANLVVLSGCDTALGKLSTGDELVGLTRAFIYAGTPSVVASLWSVDDSSTAQLMASFYRNLKTMSKVEALRQAQLELIRGEGRSDMLARRGVGGISKLGETPEPQSPSQDPISVSTSHPYFWAPFILVGDGK